VEPAIGVESAGGRAAARPTYEDEQSLVRGLRAGCEEAYGELVRLHAEKLYEVARRILGDAEDARDAVQETFIATHRAIHRFAGTAALSTWLHRVAVNAALMILRRRRRRPELPLDGGDLGSLLDARHLRGPSSWGTADAEAERRELIAFVHACIAELPASHREVLLLREIGGHGTVEIAGRLGLSANAVKLRAYRARQALRSRVIARAAELVPDAAQGRHLPVG
jgi:RNA polymerase sigma-70 factor (ECF subfamily)